MPRMKSSALEALKSWVGEAPSILDSWWESPVKRTLSAIGADSPTEQILGVSAPLAITTKRLGKNALKLLLEDDRGTGLLALNKKEFPGYLQPTLVQSHPSGKGIATDLYKEALELAEREGLGGIVSDPTQRTLQGEDFWRNLAERLGAARESNVIGGTPVDILRKKR